MKHVSFTNSLTGATTADQAVVLPIGSTLKQIVLHACFFTTAAVGVSAHAALFMGTQSLYTGSGIIAHLEFGVLGGAANQNLSDAIVVPLLKGIRIVSGLQLTLRVQSSDATTGIRAALLCYLD